jgi:hypothetical protein
MHSRRNLDITTRLNLVVSTVLARAECSRHRCYVRSRSGSLAFDAEPAFRASGRGRERGGAGRAAAAGTADLRHWSAVTATAVPSEDCTAPATALRATSRRSASKKLLAIPESLRPQRRERSAAAALWRAALLGKVRMSCSRAVIERGNARCAAAAQDLAGGATSLLELTSALEVRASSCESWLWPAPGRDKALASCWRCVPG